MKVIPRHRACVAAALTTCALAAARGEPGGRDAALDWPGWRGPTGDARCPALPERLPDHPRLLWKQAMGGVVHSGVIIADSRVVTMDHTPGREDAVACFRADTGEPLWRRAWPNEDTTMDWGACPRATPLAHGGAVFAIGAIGAVRAFRGADGAPLWQKDFVGDFEADIPMWGHCASPVVAGGRVIVTPGAETRSMAALDPASGEPAWVSSGERANYGSPLVVTGATSTLVIAFDQLNLTARDAADGRAVWSRELPSPIGYLVPSPVAAGGRLVLCGEFGARAMRIDVAGPQGEAWDAENADFVVGDGTPAIVDGLVLGVTGAGLAALSLSDGLRRLWAWGDDPDLRDFGNLIVAPGRALVLDESGALHLFAVSEKGASRIGRAAVCGKTRAAPALAGTRLFVRDAHALRAYDLQAGGASVP